MQLSYGHLDVPPHDGRYLGSTLRKDADRDLPITVGARAEDHPDRECGQGPIRQPRCDRGDGFQAVGGDRVSIPDTIVRTRGPRGVKQPLQRARRDSGGRIGLLGRRLLIGHHLGVGPSLGGRGPHQASAASQPIAFRSVYTMVCSVPLLRNLAGLRMMGAQRARRRYAVGHDDD